MKRNWKNDRKGRLYHTDNLPSEWGTTIGAMLAIEQLVDPLSGEVIVKANEIMSAEQYQRCLDNNPIAYDGSEWRTNIIPVWVPRT